MPYNKAEKQTHKNRKKNFGEFFDELTDDDFLARCDVIFLQKKRAMRLPFQNKSMFYITLI